MLKIEKISIKYIKQFYTLFEVSGEFYAGDKVLLVGDDNSGNRALLRVIAKIDKPNSGKIDYDEFSKKDIGYLPISPVVFKRKSVRENILYSLKIRKVPKAVAQSKVETILNEYGYSSIADKKLCDCSDKEKYAVTIMRLLVREPRLVLIELPNDMDEDILLLINQLIRQSEICLMSSKTEKESIVHTRVLRMYNGSMV